MKLSKWLFLLSVVATVLLISKGTLASTETKKHKKEKKEQQTVVDTPPTSDADPPQTDNNAVINQVDSNNAEDGQLLDITPSEEHNGKLGRKHHNKDQKQRRKERRKEERKQERKQAKREQKHHKNRHSDNTLTKQERKQAKKAARKELRKQQKLEAGTEIVSFDDIVQERHGDPIPNPLPPVEGTATESQATGNEVKRRHHKSHNKHENKKRRLHGHGRHGNSNKSCADSTDCANGQCCVEKKGFCKPSNKDEGQKCIEDCMCGSGLVCVPEVIAPGKERGFCRVRGTQLNTDSRVGEIEDAVENVMDGNQ